MTNPKSVRVRALLVAMLVACPFSAPPAAMAHTPAPSGGQVLVGEPAVYEMRLPDPETLKPLAEAGDLKAQFELSQVYAWGDPQDFKASEYWLRRAADAGYVPAQADLGMGLGLGAGATGRLPHEPVEGLMWLILASIRDRFSGVQGAHRASSRGFRRFGSMASRSMTASRPPSRRMPRAISRTARA